MLFTMLLNRDFPLNRVGAPRFAHDGEGGLRVESFEVVGVVEASCAEGVFQALQEPSTATGLVVHFDVAAHRSFSVGDVLVTQDEVHHCLSRGWAVFPLPESWRQALFPGG